MFSKKIKKKYRKRTKKQYKKKVLKDHFRLNIYIDNRTYASGNGY